MVSIAEYIRWLGRFSFDELPFCEADALVMCVVSYFDLGPVLAGSSASPTLADCSRAHEAGLLHLQITGSDMGNGEIFREAASSKRFGPLVLEGCEDVLMTEPPVQFSAVTLSWKDTFSFIAYRGTDETISGWREDFMISFDRTDAQRLALEYAQSRIAPGRTWYIAGHSKGGNLALYTACMLQEITWENVGHVYILDGPGLCPEVMDTSLAERIDPKTTRIIPEYSVIGQLFEPKISDTRIIRSFRRGILQHSLATWGIEYGALAETDKNDSQSVFLMHILNRWIASLDMQERKTMTDDLFDTLAAGGAVTLSDIESGGREGFAAVLARMFKASPVTRRVIRELQTQALTAVWRELTHEADE